MLKWLLLISDVISVEQDALTQTIYANTGDE